MNNAYKVVFNKARGALMVANEITSSVQKKGTKTVLAAAALTLLAVGAADAQNMSGTFTVDGQSSSATTNNNVTTYATENADTVAFSKEEGLILSVGSKTSEDVVISGKNISFSGSTGGSVSLIQTRGDEGADSTLTIGGQSTETFKLTNSGTDDWSAGIYALGAAGAAAGKGSATIAINAKNIIIDSNWGVHVQGNTEVGELPKDHLTKVSLSGDNISINSKTIGLSAFSHGQLNVNGNLTVNSTGGNAIDGRGNSSINVNVDGKHATVLNGDIVFETPNAPGDSQNSGKIINSNVTVNFVGTYSSWTGRSYQEYRVKVGEKYEYQHLIGLEGDASYHGNVTGLNLTFAEGATWNVTDDSFVNNLTLKNGGVIKVDDKVQTINVGSWEATTQTASQSESNQNTTTTTGRVIPGFKIEGTGNQLTLGKDTKLNGKIVMANGSELITPLSTAFTTVTDENKSVKGATARLDLATEGSDTATLTINDKFTYTADGITAMGSSLDGTNISLNLVNAELYQEKTDDGASNTNSTLVNNIVQEKLTVETKVNVDEDGSATVEAKNTGGKTLVVSNSATNDDATVAKSVTLKAPAQSATSTGTPSITLVGEAGSDVPLITNSKGEAIDSVKVEDLTLKVGFSASETQGALKALEIASGAGLDVVNAAATVESLVANGAINVGNSGNRGALKITDTFTIGAGSVIFLDPAFKDDAPLVTTAGASHLEIAALDATGAAGKLVAGRNSVIAIGGTAADVDAALAKFGLAWGAKDVTAALYAGSTIDVASTGAVVVDGSLTAAPASYATGAVRLADNALLVVDQAKVGDVAINGKLAGTAKSVVGVVNAAEGEFTLAKDGVTGLGDKVLTDNVFVSGKLAGNTVTTTVDNAALGGAIASLGIQQMARRADTVMANTVADRTSRTIAGSGVSLWADVGGERYEADDLQNGAQYKANMFYGSFGGDVGIIDGLRVGAAVQYGTGDSKSHNYGIKNDIDAIGFTLYGAYDVASACKLVGEIAYTQTSNDISSSNAQLKNDVDADVFSVGVRGQHTFVAGPVEIIPSIGVRWSRISTDAFNVGAIRVDADDQNIWQVPLSVTVAAKGIEAAGWTMNPYVKASFTPTFGDDEISLRGYDQDALDTLPVQGDFGLSASYGNVTLGAGLQAGFGKDGAQNWGGKVNVRYAF